jgi:hypothetical protein
MLALFSRFFRRQKVDGVRAPEAPASWAATANALLGGKLQHGCPACGCSKPWGVHPSGPVGLMAVLETGEHVQIPSIQLFCSNCGLMTFHNLSWLQSANAGNPQTPPDRPEERQKQEEKETS